MQGLQEGGARGTSYLGLGISASCHLPVYIPKSQHGSYFIYILIAIQTSYIQVLTRGPRS